MSIESKGTIYKSKSAKNSVSYTAWVVFTAFLIGIIGVVALTWGLLIQFEVIEQPRILESDSLYIGSLVFLYLTGSLINGYKSRRPSHAVPARHAHHRDSVRQDATQRP